MMRTDRKKFAKKALAVRLISILLIVLLTAALAGCASGESDAPADPAQIRLHWLICGEKSKSSDTVIARFNEQLHRQFPGVTIEFEIVPRESYKERWNMAMAVNETLDIAWIGNDLFNYTEEVNKGSFTALDYLLSIAGGDLISSIPAEQSDKQKRDGKTYGIPLTGPLYREDYAAVFNQADMAAFGDSGRIAETVQSRQYADAEVYRVFEEYLQTMAEQQKLGTGISCGTFRQTAQIGYEGIYGSDSPFVIRIFDDSLRVYNKYELDSYRDYFAAMQSWYEKGYIRPDIDEVIAPEKENGIRSGNLIYLEEYGENGVAADTIRADYETVSIPLQNYKYIGYAFGRNALVIPRTTAHPQTAVEVINYLNTDAGRDLCRLLCNGTEGRHYVRLNDDLIRPVMDSDGEPIYSLSAYTFCSAFQNFEKTAGELEQITEYNEHAIRSPLTGFELDTRMIIIELEKVDLIAAEYLEELFKGTGGDWQVRYDEMIRRMKEAGADRIIEEIQRQLDEFAAEDTK